MVTGTTYDFTRLSCSVASAIAASSEGTLESVSASLSFFSMAKRKSIKAHLSQRQKHTLELIPLFLRLSL